MKRIIALPAILASVISAEAQNITAGERIVCDETCREEYQRTEITKASVPTLNVKTKAQSGADSKAATAPLYSVVSPVGHSSVEMIRQAPRLETLDGKTIAVVGVSFMTGITHPEIKRLIKENYPRANVILSDEIGISGPYPAPGITRKQNEEFKRKLQEMGVDALISGNGGCGLCTPKEVGSCITAEHLGIPSVMIAGPGFSDQARYTSRNNGVPVMRVAEYPGAFAADSQETLLRNTREVLWPQIVKALTTPISPEELSAARDKTGDLRDDVFYGTLEEVDDYF
ncbi:MAG: hypothetical protein MJY55_05995, partial [Bacteroidales bacterium]|nr:hypothetical protein [Bacteroidales bacterium]